VGQKKKENRWFRPDIDFPESSEDWSEFNMNLFAKDEGFKVIAMDNDNLVDEFVNDLNAIVETHNEYHFQYREKNHDDILVDNEWTDEVIFKRDDNAPVDSAEMVADYKDDQEVLWTNFELINGDNYDAMDKKIRQMHLPRFSKDWLNTVLTKGIHTGTMDRPEVMVFLHSLCGFWFDKFYEKYLEQDQLDVIFERHMDNFKY